MAGLRYPNNTECGNGNRKWTACCVPVFAPAFDLRCVKQLVGCTFGVEVYTLRGYLGGKRSICIFMLDSMLLMSMRICLRGEGGVLNTQSVIGC